VEKTAFAADRTVAFQRIDVERCIDFESHAPAVASAPMLNKSFFHQ
jgi:hypothetical protein